MGDCGIIMQSANFETSAAQGMYDARDIARRFEQLETQWMSFQKNSTKLEADKDNSQKLVTSQPRDHLQKDAVSSAASSYSNPLFANHSISKPAQLPGDRTSSSSSRTWNLCTDLNPGRAPFSCIRQRKAGALSTSPRDVTTSMDDHSSSLVSSSLLGSSCQNPGNAFSDGQAPHSNETMVTRATVATFFRAKPSLGSAVQTTSKAPKPGNEKYDSRSTSVTRQTRRKRINHRKELQNSLKLPEILGLDRPQLPTPMTRPSTGNDFRESIDDMIESLHSVTYPSTSDPATYPSGSKFSESYQSSDLEHSTGVHVNELRSPPSPSHTSTTVADLQLNPLLGYDGFSDRNISWRVLGDRGVLTEGSFRMDRHPAEHHEAQFKSQEDNNIAIDMLVQNGTEVSSKSGDLLKPEVQIDQKNVLEAEHVTLGDRLDKVNWELRLSKREAALRIAEGKVLEDEKNILQARLAVSKCEDALRKREQDVQVELEKQKIDFGESLKSLETGKTVMQNLCTGLRDVLRHLELKESVFQNSWVELKDSVDSTSVFGDHSFGFEPELTLEDRRNGTFNSLSFLIVKGKGEEWCSTVVGICERLVSYMSRETHLQKWAVVLEREGMRMSKMTLDIAKAKELANEQCARSEEMMKCAEEQAACMDEERVKLARERDNLILWVTHLQERRKAVAECEREAAKSLAEVQKKAADLFVHESDIDERALEICALQEELRVTSQRLQCDQELNNREKHKVQEKMRQAAGRESEVESKVSAMKKLQEDLNSKAEQLEKDRVDERKKEILLLTLHEAEERINAKEISVSELEKELEHKVAVVEERTISINDREKLLAEVQLHTEQERSKISELMTVLEKEKMRLKKAEEAVVEAHSSKKSAEDAWVRTAQERRESSEYLRSVEDRLKQWEEKLRSKEKELKGQQKKLQVIENHAREEQRQSEALHAKMIQEQESWTQELKVKQDSLSKQNEVLDAKEEKITNDLDRLTEERRVALEDIKRLAEVEARAWGAERDLQTKYDDHLKEVRKHASEYNTQVEDLALAKREVKRELVELRAKKQELKIWQREAEETLQNRIDSFVKGKEELTSQIKELKKLQMDIEQAGSQIIDRVAELDEASSRLERQRYKVEISKKKLEAIADKLATHQEILKRRECEFLTQESKLVAVQNGLKKMAAEAATKEKNLRCREQAVVDSENDLYDVEARLANERKDLEIMLAEVEQHAAKLKEETTSVEEINRCRMCDKLVIEERQKNQQKKELAEFETGLRNKSISVKEHGQNISKLEMQVKGWSPRAVDIETQSEQLEKGWENCATEREALIRTKAEIQGKAENDEAQRQVYSEMCEGKRKQVEILEEPCAREATLEACEIRASGRETLLLKMELDNECCDGQFGRPPQNLQQQLQFACTQLEDRRRYVEEACTAAKTVAAVVQERGSKFRLEKQGVAEREVTDSYQGLHGGDGREKLEGSWSNIVGGSSDFQHQSHTLGMPQSSTGVDVADWMSKSGKREVRFGFQHVSEDRRTEQVLVRKQLDEGMEDKHKHMEEAFQKEAAKISQERANLKVQQQELEETRKAVEEVKLTLETQLKATKQMVAGASLTAQNASREREALEEERKRIAQDRKDAEASVAANEEKLAMEAKHLETMKSMLEQEKTKAMEMIQQATTNAMSAEYAKAESSSAQVDSLLLHKESQFEASLKDKAKEPISTSETIQRDKNNLEIDRAQVTILHDALEREQMEHPYAMLRNTTKFDCVRHDAENQLAWKEMKRERIIGEANCWDPTSEGSSNHISSVREQEFSFSALKSAMEIDGAIANFGDGSGGSIYKCCELANSKTSNIEWDEAFGSSTSSTNATCNHATPEKVNIVSNSRRILEKNGVPSLQRLENVMTSLTYARQASRSRLQRTKNALHAFPPSSGFITQVQQALNALSSRLSLMEQIEEGLESHLRSAYETELPESERVLVDKVQLLCRLEEQQSLRAEWEEDMQRQLETISILQAACRSSPSFSSPPRDLHEGVSPMNDWQNHSRNSYQSGSGLGSFEKTNSGGYTDVNSSVDLHKRETSGPSKQFYNLNWNQVFERGDYSDSTGLCNFPCVAYDYLSNPPDHDANELGTDGLETRERITRRKLVLTPPRVTYV